MPTSTDATVDKHVDTGDNRTTLSTYQLIIHRYMAKNSYSAKAGAAGKDLGKPGKNFDKIASSAAKEYGSAAAGKRVAGAVLNKLRNK